jgi:hypothetical protein
MERCSPLFLFSFLFTGLSPSLVSFSKKNKVQVYKPCTKSFDSPVLLACLPACLPQPLWGRNGANQQAGKQRLNSFAENQCTLTFFLYFSKRTDFIRHYFLFPCWFFFLIKEVSPFKFSLSICFL